jgi:preprotein translocase subunit SecG
VIEQIIIVVHVLVALSIIGLVLLQQGKGADMGASFGGGGSQTLFGAAGGGSVLTRATAILAVTFFVTSFGLAIIAKQKASSVSAVDDLFSASALEADAAANDAQAALEAQLDQLPEPGAYEPNAGVDLSDIGIPDDAQAVDVVDSIPQ